ncbi:hypothetical protein ACIPPJ_00010 [Streptomyces sp. NPDC086091]|uniref:hypothetical protein n=1 Tax=Streptomyces sp. NPDC086091 TaxID=3365751 RepID=UPI00381B95E7
MRWRRRRAEALPSGTDRNRTGTPPSGTDRTGRDASAQSGFLVEEYDRLMLLRRFSDELLVPADIADLTRTLESDADGTMTVVAGADEASAPALWPRLAALLDTLRGDGVDTVRLAMSGAGDERPGMPSVARRIADAWGFDVIAPDGTVLGVPGGGLFVHDPSPGPGPADREGGWWLFSPGAPAVPLGPRQPAPDWQPAPGSLPSRTSGGCVVQHIPAGVLVRPERARAPRPGDLCFAVPVDRRGLLVVVGVPDGEDVVTDDVAEVVTALTDTARTALRLAPGGRRDVLRVGQGVAELTDADVVVYSGLPLLTDSGRHRGTVRSTAVGTDGTPSWQPFVDSVICAPGASSPRLLRWTPPLTGPGDPRRGLVRLSDRWQVTATRAGLWISGTDTEPGALAARPVDARGPEIEVGRPGEVLDRSLSPVLERLLAGLPPGMSSRARVQVHGTAADGGQELRRLAAQYQVRSLRFATFTRTASAGARPAAAQAANEPAGHPSTSPGERNRPAVSGGPDPATPTPAAPTPAAHAPAAGVPPQTAAAPPPSPTPPRSVPTVTATPAAPTGATVGASATTSGPRTPHRPDRSQPLRTSGAPTASAAPAATVLPEPKAAAAAAGTAAGHAARTAASAGATTGGPQTRPQARTAASPQATEPDREGDKGNGAPPPPAPELEPGPGPASEPAPASEPTPDSTRSTPEHGSSQEPSLPGPPVRPRLTSSAPAEEPSRPAAPRETSASVPAAPTGTPTPVPVTPNATPAPAPVPPTPRPVPETTSVPRPVRPAQPLPAVPFQPGHQSTAAERAAFRVLADALWDRQAAVVTRAFTRMPALRGPEQEAARADLVALLLYLRTTDGPLGHAELDRCLRTGDPRLLPYAACVASALRRMPSFRGPALRGTGGGGGATPVPGAVLRDPAPVSALPSDGSGARPASTRYAVWSVTGRRVRHLFGATGPQAQADEVVFAPGTLFKVLDVRGEGPTPLVLLRELPAAAGAAPLDHTPLDDQDRTVLARLDDVLAQRPSGAGTFGWPGRCAGPLGSLDH